MVEVVVDLRRGTGMWTLGVIVYSQFAWHSMTAAVVRSLHLGTRQDSQDDRCILQD